MSYNYMTNRDSPNYTPYASVPAVYGMPRVIEGVTLHHWGDPNNNPQFGDVVNYLCRAGGNTSAHYVATGTGRQVACIVDPANVAWHSGSAWGNAKTIGIELDPRARDEDYDVAAELVADIRSAYGDVPIYWHSYFVATACPGAWNAERLDELSYTKYSHATEWGQGGNKNQTPAPAPTPAPEPTPTPAPLYKLVVDTKQVAAYSSDSNAYKGWVQYGSRGKIFYDGSDLTRSILEKFAPSPTTGQPDSGAPVVDKADYEATKARVTALEKIVQTIVEFLSNLFKGFNK
jgi:hypothetical protein